ncbi:hypothetical protein AG1IA_04132 [Rhizoctonia solani AG-1 IA]|uniref:Uncharacterized protein n=1 Tax=Thanatephorus cucumeris (strain AG1-IA) TaxID=983506 RepID=L8WYD4_THACA|nr:hypothetical protein AG1IA_04132 [Rhizoctonia solani AG-1 IA]
MSQGGGTPTRAETMAVISRDHLGRSGALDYPQIAVLNTQFLTESRTMRDQTHHRQNGV